MADFKVKFSSTGGTFRVKMQTEGEDFRARFGSVQTVTKTELDYYDGPYEVTPKINAQTLATAKKAMADDLTVKAIPYAEVSNNFGGKTITIGG